MESLAFILALPATKNVHDDEVGGQVAMYLRASVVVRAYRRAAVSLSTVPQILCRALSAI